MLIIIINILNLHFYIQLGGIVIKPEDVDKASLISYTFGGHQVWSHGLLSPPLNFTNGIIKI